MHCGWSYLLGNWGQQKHRSCAAPHSFRMRYLSDAWWPWWRALESMLRSVITPFNKKTSRIYLVMPFIFHQISMDGEEPWSATIHLAQYGKCKSGDWNNHKFLWCIHECIMLTFILSTATYWTDSSDPFSVLSEWHLLSRNALRNPGLVDVVQRVSGRSRIAPRHWVTATDRGVSSPPLSYIP